MNHISRRFANARSRRRREAHPTHRSICAQVGMDKVARWYPAFFLNRMLAALLQRLTISVQKDVRTQMLLLTAVATIITGVQVLHVLLKHMCTRGSCRSRYHAAAEALSHWSFTCTALRFVLMMTCDASAPNQTAPSLNDPGLPRSATASCARVQPAPRVAPNLHPVLRLLRLRGGGDARGGPRARAVAPRRARPRRQPAARGARQRVEDCTS